MGPVRAQLVGLAAALLAGWRSRWRFHRGVCGGCRTGSCSPPGPAQHPDCPLIDHAVLPGRVRLLTSQIVRALIAAKLFKEDDPITLAGPIVHQGAGLRVVMNPDRRAPYVRLGCSTSRAPRLSDVPARGAPVAAWRHGDPETGVDLPADMRASGCHHDRTRLHHWARPATGWAWSTSAPASALAPWTSSALPEWRAVSCCAPFPEAANCHCARWDPETSAYWKTAAPSARERRRRQPPVRC